MTTFDFSRIFGNSNRSTSNTKKQRQRSRTCRIEELESREMLDAGLMSAMSDAFYQTSQSYQDNAAAEWVSYFSPDYNRLEIAADQLSAANIQAAIDEAAQTVEDDLIVVRMESFEAGAAALSNDIANNGALRIDFDSYMYGGVSIVAMDAAGNTAYIQNLLGRLEIIVCGNTFFNNELYFARPEYGITEEGTGDTVSPFMSEAKPLVGMDDYLNDSRFSSLTGTGYTTVIIDTGIYYNHTEFANKIVYSYDFAGADLYASDPDSDATDYQGHGTHVASIAAGWNHGIAKGADIIMLKVFPDYIDGATNTDITSALQWVINNAATYNIASVNMSLGGSNFQTRGDNTSIWGISFDPQLHTLADMGVIVTVATGNSYISVGPGIATPATNTSVVSVSATYDQSGGASYYYGYSSQVDTITDFAQRGAGLVDILAPGAWITAAGINGVNSAATLIGTSMATPIVAGAAVLAQQVANTYLGRSLTVDEFKNLINQTGVVVVDNVGYGLTPTYATYARIDVYALAQAIYDMSPADTEPGDTLATARTVTFNNGVFTTTQRIGDGLYGNKDVDMYQFTVSAADVGKEFTFRTSQAAGGASFDSYIRLFNSAGTCIAANDDYNSLWSYLSWMPTTAGTYYMGVSSYPNHSYNPNTAGSGVPAGTGDYMLTMTRPAAAPIVETASTIVTTLNDIIDAYDGVISLREAIAYAGTGGLGTVITFTPSLQGGTITLNGSELSINKNLSIDGTGQTIDADQKSRVFSIGSGATVALAGLTITGGYSNRNDGGGILNSGNLTVTNSTIIGNTATGTANDWAWGGGIYSSNNLAVTNSTIAGNAAQWGGGIEAYGTLTITNSTITGNSATDIGGGINTSALTTITNSLIAGNSADWGGGGIYNFGNLTVTNSTIAGNNATARGGIYTNAVLSGKSVSLYNTIVAENSYDDISHTEGQSVSYSGSNSLIGNGTGQTGLINGQNGNIVGTATNPIDPMFVNAAQGDYRLAAGSRAINAGNNALIPSGITTDLDGKARIIGGTVDIGAYEYQNRTVETASTVVTTLNDIIDAYDGVISLREAIAYAGTGGLGTAITFTPSLQGGTITLNGSELSINKNLSIDGTGQTIDADQKSRVFSIGSGATVALAGLTITGGYIWGDIDNGGGGGIHNWGATLTITDCTISGNSAGYGGGIVNAYGTLTITNSRIVENSAYGGGGIANGDLAGTAVLNVTNSTIAGNSADWGGGIYTCYSSDSIIVITLNNTIFAKNTAQYSGTHSVYHHGTLIGNNNLLDYSVSGTGRSSLINGQNGNIVGTATNPIDPMFVNAAQGDYRLAAGSRAINAGNNALAVDANGNPLQYDLDGKARIIGGTVDIGAYESDYVTAAPLASPTITDVLHLPWGEILITWSNVAHADSYVLEYATTDSFANAQTIAVTEAWASLGILNNTTYYLRVMAIGTGDYSNSDYSSVVSVRNVIPLTAPTLGNVTATGSRTISVAWSTVANASGYVIQYATNSAFTTGVGTKTVTGTSTTLENLSANTTYYVRVMAAGTGNYSDSEWSSTKSAVTARIELAVPQIGYAVVLDDEELVVTWYSVPNAGSYVVQYATTNSFSNARSIAVSSTWLSLKGAALAGFDPNATYYFRVKAVGTGDYSDSGYSGVVSATTPAVRLNAPRLTGVSAGADKMSITWESVAHADGYVVEYSTKETFDTLIGSIPADSSTTSTDIDGLEANTTYYVRVKATGNGIYNDSDYSAAQSATTDEAATVPPGSVTIGEEEEEVTPDIDDSTHLTPFKFAVDNALPNVLTISWAEETLPSDSVFQYSLDGTEWMTWKGKLAGTGTTIPGLAAGTYDVRLMDANGETIHSETGISVAAVYTSANPLKPKVKVDKSATTIGSIALTWANNTKANAGKNIGSNARYVITCLVKSGKNWTPVEQFTTTDSRYTFTGLNHSTSYKFTVTAVNADGKQTDARGREVAVSVTAKTAKYTAVQKLKKAVAADTATLTWQPSTAKLAGATPSYEILWFEGGSKTPSALPEAITVGITGTTATITGLPSQMPYKFAVREIAMVGDTVLNTSLDSMVSVKTL